MMTGTHKVIEHSVGIFVQLTVIYNTCSGTLYVLIDNIESQGNMYLLSIRMAHDLSIK